MSAKSRLQINESAELNMTPMIDIVFNLLIFFMVVTDLSQKDLADLVLPLASASAQDKGKEKDDRVIVNVDKNGVIIVNGKHMNLDELGAYLKYRILAYGNKKGDKAYEVLNGTKASKLFVLLRADRFTPWEHVQWIMQVMATVTPPIYKLQFATKQFVDKHYTSDRRDINPQPNLWRELGGVQRGGSQ